MKTFSTSFLLAGFLACALAGQAAETPAQGDQRMEWWRAARLGTFIHFYTTTANPVGAVPWGCITAKHAKLYLHVFDWPKDNQVLVPSKAGGALSARMLADRTRRPLACERTDAGVRVTLEPGFQNPYASVAVLGVGATTK